MPEERADEVFLPLIRRRRSQGQGQGNSGRLCSFSSFTVMIFYDIKSLTWYPTISWTVCETRIFLQTWEAKITTEIQRNVKLLHLLNEKEICLTVRGEKIQFRGKIGSGYTGGRSRELYGQRWNFFGFKMEPDFPNFFLNLDFQDSENETPTKRIK